MISGRSKSLNATVHKARDNEHPRYTYIVTLSLDGFMTRSFIHRTTKELEMNDGIFRRYLFNLTRPGFRAIHWDVGGRIILVKPRARVLDVINNAGIIVLILSP